ncbi:DUF559 domain-containing protein [Agromyces allii]|uniref:DUF559 domain-containing protein n=1 Tax=Agromyces allii TaxID=393607 RepID=A0ABN2Q7Q0_9MICO|nr:DUF559 domain-containing protein [Agromyces allii]
MHVGDWIDHAGGIAHTNDALRAGFTRYSIKAAVDARVVRRIRRSWLATVNAPSSLAAAAWSGGRVACLSAASHHGLWTLDDERFHLAVPPHSGHVRRGGALVHWSTGPIPIARTTLVEPVVNALWQIADCRPFEHALATWESAIRSGQISVDLLDRLPMTSAAGRAVRSACSQLSDSGIESIPVARLARIGITVAQQVVLDAHAVDGLIGDRLVLQIDGYAFHRTAEQRQRDIAADRRLRLMGYTVFRIGYADVLNDWERVELEICTAIAQGLHLARSDDVQGGVRHERRRRTARAVLPTR